MTEDGLLAVPDAVASNWLSESALTAELVFDEVLEDGQDDSDYHNTINGAKIIAWLRNRLFPTFEHLYPGKKMYLVLDNATYHAPRDETWISASKAQNKHTLAHQLLDLEVTELTTVDDSHRIVPAHLFEAKRYVAERCYHKRSPEEARAQTEEGFAQVTYGFILNIIKHCHDWIDGFLATEEAGDLRQCGTLAGVIKWLPLLKAAGDSRPTLTGAPTTQPMDISPPPPTPASAPAACSRTLRKRR
jgi:hypothetical protein